VAGVRAWTAATSFREVAPNILVQGTVEAITTFVSGGMTSAWSGRSEHQRLLRVDFLRPLPLGELRNGN